MQFERCYCHINQITIFQLVVVPSFTVYVCHSEALLHVCKKNRYFWCIVEDHIKIVFHYFFIKSYIMGCTLKSPLQVMQPNGFNDHFLGEMSLVMRKPVFGVSDQV